MLIWTIGATEMLIILVVIGIGILPVIFYLLTLQNTLKEVSPHNRKMPPSEVWLMFIPLFNLVWQFMVVNRIADSLKAEFQERGIVVTEKRPGAGVGIASCILGLCGIIPFLGGFASLAGFVCWIVYWVKISGYKNKIIAHKLSVQNQNTIVAE